MKHVLMPQFISLGIIVVIAATIFLSDPAAAQMSIFDGVNAAQGADAPSTLFGDGGVITQVINVLLFIAGALSVIMLIIGGLRYTISGGNASAVSAAKNTVLYAIIGLLIAFFAYAIINWVISAVSLGGSASGTDV